MQNEFLAAFEENLDLAPGTLTLETEYKDLPEWDSLAQLSLMTVIEDLYGKVIDPALIRNSRTVGQLLDAIGTA